MRIVSGALAAAAALATTVALAAPAQAQELRTYGGAVTFEATTADGGAITARSRSVSQGGDDPEHPSRLATDHYGAVGSSIEVERLSTYRVTVTFEGVEVDATETGRDAEARAFGQVELYECCFAGEQYPISQKSVDAPVDSSGDGDLTVTTEVYAYDDFTLAIQSELHAYAATSTAYAGETEVSASSQAVTVDVTQIDDGDDGGAGEQPEEPAPSPGGLCILGLCL